MINLYVFGDGGVSDSVRLKYPISNMKEDDDFKYKITSGTIRNGTQLPVDSNGVYVFSRPMSNLEFAVNKIKTEHVGARIIVDVDDNFWNLPKSHIAYDGIGPQTYNIRSLERILSKADAVTVSTEPLKELIISRGFAKEATVIPNVCNLDNPFIAMKRPSSYLRFGFSGTITHRDDFKIILSPLTKFINEHENVKIVIASDAEIYKTLKNIPENKKMFVPAYPYEYYPIQLSYFDIMLIPLVNDAFNRAKSDIKLLDAVANNKPFIASEVTPYAPYNDGDSTTWAGLVTENNTEAWYSAMCYMLNENNRKSFISAGEKIKAEKNVSLSSAIWKEVIKGVLK